MLNYHVQNTDLNNDTSYVMQSHASAVLMLIAQVTVIDQKSVLPYINLLTDAAITKWSRQFSNFTEFFCKLRIELM